jgi:hypothetical protein
MILTCCDVNPDYNLLKSSINQWINYCEIEKKTAYQQILVCSIILSLKNNYPSFLTNVTIIIEILTVQKIDLNRSNYYNAMNLSHII